jgi:malate dehydrogenase (oxaloacetate-decarboxylating)(NADP+)
VNNVLGFPFIFRGALDVRATRINEEMKIAAAEALAELAREPVPEEVAAAYGGRMQSFGRDYIIPAPFDPRLMEIVASAVAEAAVKSGVAQKPLADMSAYRATLRARQNPTVSVLSLAYEAARANPKRVLFAEGEEPSVLRAAIAFKEAGYGTPVLVGREETYDLLREHGVENPKDYEVLNSRNSPLVSRAVDFIYKKHQRHGMLRREIERLVNQDRNYFASAMLALGEADAMITGTTRPFSQSLRQVRMVIDDEPGATPFGVSVVVARHQTVMIADTAVTERPDAEQLAAIALRSAGFARRMGLDPRIAFISYTTFGNPPGVHIEELRGAVKLLDGIKCDFEYEGEMGPDVALNYDMQRRFYPFSRLSGPANVLVMPGLQSASLSSKLLRELGGESILGPYILGLEMPVQIAPMTASASDLVTLAVLAAVGVRDPARKASRARRS